MKRIRRVLVVAVLILSVLTYWSYRKTIALVEASEFQLVASVLPTLPEGTTIRAVLSNGITKATRAGDEILAFGVAPVLINGQPVLPAGIRLKGVVEHIEFGHQAQVKINFDEIILGNTPSPMETEPVVATTRPVTDIKLLTDVLNIMTGSGVGIAIGVGSQDRNVIAHGLAQGAQFGVPGPTQKSAQVTVVLTKPLRIQT